MKRPHMLVFHIEVTLIEVTLTNNAKLNRNNLEQHILDPSIQNSRRFLSQCTPQSFPSKHEQFEDIMACILGILHNNEVSIRLKISF